VRMQGEQMVCRWCAHAGCGVNQGLKTDFLPAILRANAGAQEEQDPVKKGGDGAPT